MLVGLDMTRSSGVSTATRTVTNPATGSTEVHSLVTNVVPGQGITIADMNHTTGEQILYKSKPSGASVKIQATSSWSGALPAGTTIPPQVAAVIAPPPPSAAGAAAPAAAPPPNTPGTIAPPAGGWPSASPDEPGTPPLVVTPTPWVKYAAIAGIAVLAGMIFFRE